jgi:voltage-gated potassium channel
MATPIFRWRHLTLLVLLLVILIVTPILAPLRHGLLVLNVIGATVLVAGSYAISDRRHLFTIGIVLSVVSLIGNWFLVTFPSHWLIVAAHSCVIVLLGFFAVTILAYVVGSGRVTSDKIFAAICAYLLIGYAWAFGYALLNEFQPHAFAAVTDVSPNDYVGRVVQMRYFSFVTLTTVGYGDIVPRSSGAQTMAILEAIVGQFYLVALIGRLVGLHIIHGTSSASSGEN